jgi:hypothetical protein
VSAYQQHHYVPQWYQRRFIPAEQAGGELYLLDLEPEAFTDGRGRKHRKPAVRRTGTRRCFAERDLYTVPFAGRTAHDVERVFFGRVDAGGKPAVEYIAGYDHDSADGTMLRRLLTYMSLQKLRTPKGLDWVSKQSGAATQEDRLRLMMELRDVWGVIWAESVWQLADATASQTKFIVSDHPVTVYNRACAPSNTHYCRYPDDPDTRLHATHTIFALDIERVLILTNQTWATNPYRSPTQLRPNPNLYRDAMFNFFDVQVDRQLSEREVLEINFVLKSRARRYVAAAKEEWLYPEKHLGAVQWRAVGDGYLFMPDPRSLIPGSEMTMGYSDGSHSTMDNFGRRPGQPGYGSEGTDAKVRKAHADWKEEFVRRYGRQRRGMAWEDKPRDSSQPDSDDS